ncbi:hypothetical protein HUJ04_002695 [Dendroctonus ponderosae]|nr:hypothetical protein HUJ04_002695 [Dendroctonus ponderosae]
MKNQGIPREKRMFIVLAPTCDLKVKFLILTSCGFFVLVSIHCSSNESGYSGILEHYKEIDKSETVDGYQEAKHNSSFPQLIFRKKRRKLVAATIIRKFRIPRADLRKYWCSEVIPYFQLKSS